jgi:hypothetical protein
MTDTFTCRRCRRFYEEFMGDPQGASRNLMAIGQSYKAARKSNWSNEIGRTSMSSFAPQAVFTPHHFEITEDERGYWVAKDKEGLVGGVFRSRKDALRFALFEVDGDSACVRVLPRTKS